MQIVIDIPDEWKTRIEYNQRPNTIECGELVESIWKGKILPKNHSRLIEADELIKQAWDADDSKMGWIYVVEVGDIENAPTIIEADKEAEDVQKPD